MEFLTETTERVASPRGRGQLLTERFGTTWPEVERPLRSYLASMGARPDQVDDVVQETAFRALARGVEYEDAADLRRWCFVVARRLWVDDLRRHRRSAALDEAVALRDRNAEDDLARVEDRLLLKSVAAALAALRPADRAALRPAGDAPVAPAQRNRQNVARHRARTRLRLAVGPLVGLVSAFAGAVRRRGVSAGPGAVLALPALVAVAALQALPADVLAAPESPGRTTGARAAVQATGWRAAAPADTRATAVAAGRRGPAAVAARAVGTTAPQREERVVDIAGPAGTRAAAGRSSRRADDRLLCLNGDVVDACLDPADITPVLQPPLPLSPAR